MKKAAMIKAITKIPPRIDRMTINKPEDNEVLYVVYIMLKEADDELRWLITATETSYPLLLIRMIFSLKAVVKSLATELPW